MNKADFEVQLWWKNPDGGDAPMSKLPAGQREHPHLPKQLLHHRSPLPMHHRSPLPLHHRSPPLLHHRSPPLLHHGSPCCSNIEARRCSNPPKCAVRIQIGRIRQPTLMAEITFSSYAGHQFYWTMPEISLAGFRVQCTQSIC